MRHFLRAVALVILMSATAGANPVVRLKVIGFGTWVFEGDMETVHISATELQPIRIVWVADASHDGATIDGYRYGSNVDWIHDLPWQQDWCGLLCSPPRFLRPGVHRFDLQVRDSTHAVTMASWVIEITPVSTEAASWSDLKQRYRE